MNSELKWIKDVQLKTGAPVASEPELDCLSGSARSAKQRAYYSASDGDGTDPLHVAAYALHQLAKVKHCLVDGNKRFAWLSTVTYLQEEIGADLHADDKECIDFVLRVADGSGEPDEAEILIWLAGRLEDRA